MRCGTSDSGADRPGRKISAVLAWLDADEKIMAQRGRGTPQTASLDVMTADMTMARPSHALGRAIAGVTNVTSAGIGGTRTSASVFAHDIGHPGRVARRQRGR